MEFLRRHEKIFRVVMAIGIIALILSSFVPFLPYITR